MGKLKRWSGSAWVDAAAKRWNGSAWEDLSAIKRWTGSVWEILWQAATVTLSGAAIIDLGASPGEAGVRVNADGTVDKLVGGVYTQISASTDWIIPNGSADSTYDVRVTGVTGTFDTSPGADGTWFDLGTDRLWRISDTVDRTTSFTLEIRKDGGSALASTAYSIQITII